MPTDDDEAARVFDEQRGRLLGVAYRLTSSWADAEDVVSTAWLRWREHADTVRNPAAWLTTVVSRIALDELRSARARREQYVGPWLPEPVLQGLDGRPLPSAAEGDPADVVVMDESVRMALLVVLDTLTPEQRVAVVLHDALDLPFDQVAEAIGCTVEAARQHAVRGRRRLADAAPPPPSPPPEAFAVLDGLTAALRSGDAERVGALLTDDVVFVSDGNGRVTAARRPLHGPEEVTRFLFGLARLGLDDPALTLQPVLVNGVPGMLMRFASLRPQDPKVAVYSFTLREGRICAVHAVLAPDKVGRYA